MYKARLVAKGYAQTYGIDYEETFAPVGILATVRVVIAVATAEGWFSIYQMDVKNASLHGDFQEEMYMDQPAGYEDINHLDLVCRLCKAFYGLKQAPLAWNDKTTEYLITIGFHMADVNHTLYVQVSDRDIVVITIYVDDLTIGGDKEDEIEHAKGLLRQKLEMKDLGDMRYFLSIEIIQTPDGIWMSQRQYVVDILSK